MEPEAAKFGRRAPAQDAAEMARAIEDFARTPGGGLIILPSAITATCAPRSMSLLGVKRTSPWPTRMSANDPKRTSLVRRSYRKAIPCPYQKTHLNHYDAVSLSLEVNSTRRARFKVLIGADREAWPFGSHAYLHDCSCCFFGSVICLFGYLGRRIQAVMLLHSFGRDFKPWNEYAREIRAELDRQSPWPLDIIDHSLITARSSNENPETPFVEYLGALFAEQPLDLIVSIGAPAAAFVQRHRHELFANTPMVFTAVDERRVQLLCSSENDAVVASGSTILLPWRISCECCRTPKM